MKERLFRFKQFSVSHARSAMPVGVDGVLVGAWATCAGERILDAGTGCGMIALMMAQRNAGARILAVDTHLPSVEEASSNFSLSPWSDRLRVEARSFLDFTDEDGPFDVIVSNPPFFDAGADNSVSARAMARHVGDLSPRNLLIHGAPLLSRGGVISVIAPASAEDILLEESASVGLMPERRCLVRDHDGSPWKRILMEFGREGRDLREHLTMFGDGQVPTCRYRELCGQFYLKF